MEKNTRQKGSVAEDIAEKYLRQKGYRIITRNWYFGHLELDIIAVDGDELVIVEVKSRFGEEFAYPTDAISSKKMRQTIEAADNWIQQTEWNGDTRFDLITIVFCNENNYELEHFEDAFSP